tara:strand:- start:3396 stop:4547 length:1152 start_codon:yes stop_codon:yes gene_type:complete
MKKILVINTKYKYFGGEDANIVEELDILRNNYDVKYLEFNNSGRLNFYDYLSFLTNSNLNSNKLLNETLKNFKPDIAYIHNLWFRAGLKIFDILLKNKIKVVIKIHNYRFDCTKFYLSKNHLNDDEFCLKCGYTSKYRYSFNRYFKESYLKSLTAVRFSKTFINKLSKYSMNVCVLNNFQKNFLNNNIKNISIKRLPNPIQISENQNISYNVSSDYVVYAGLLTKEKGIDKLLETWDKLEIKNLTLKIIGTGPLENDLKKAYKSENIKFLGFLENQQSLRYVKNSKAVITATRMYEAQPRLLCEASSFGVPSIYPSFGGMNEYFPEGYDLNFEQYNYKDLEEKILLLNNKKYLEENSKKVFDYFNESLSDDSYLKKFEEIIES